MRDEFVLDPAGGLMVWAPRTGVYVHWLPVTKLQLEFFLCSDPGEAFNDKWYDALRNFEPRKTDRVSPYQVARDNYIHAFVTAILPSESQAYAQWCREQDGKRYTLPTKDEWLALFDELQTLPAKPLADVTNGRPITPRMRDMLTALDDVSRTFVPDNRQLGRSLAEQMFLRHGLFEWVSCRDAGQPEWGGFGEPAPGLGGGLYSPNSRAPKYNREAMTQRAPEYGFRLMRRGV
jgi:hypothetical protein